MNNGSPTSDRTAPAKVAGPPADQMLSDAPPDILWYNTSTNETQIWFMNDMTITGRADVLEENGSPTHVGAPWQIAGIGYF
ncbi:hypothetical protein ACIQOV_11060 [Kitasatospora sp. NPDC091257]|uniref:hypothetical protein n=1 Tax=Kitasatospora sp. NPDC091257 TaxID=3364084 RepID=UPI0037FBDA7C